MTRLTPGRLLANLAVAGLLFAIVACQMLAGLGE